MPDATRYQWISQEASSHIQDQTSTPSHMYDPLQRPSIDNVKPTPKQQRRRPRICPQIGAFFLMTLIVLLPLALIGLSALSDSGGSTRRVVNLCDKTTSFPTFFFPDILIGNFTYSQAKLINLAWNLLVGRGLQFLMVVGSYRIVMQGLTRVVEDAGVPYHLFASLAFHPGSLASIKPLVLAVVRIKGWRAKAFFAWLVYSVGVVLAVPGLFDAVNGYVRPMGVIFFKETGGRGANAYYGPSEALPREYRVGDRAMVDYVCTTELADQYRWGFVSGWILVILPLWSIWVFGMYVVWVDAQHNSRLVQSGRRFGEWASIVNLGSAIHSDLGSAAFTLSEGEMDKALGQRQSIIYEASGEKEPEVKLVLEKRSGYLRA